MSRTCTVLYHCVIFTRIVNPRTIFFFFRTAFFLCTRYLCRLAQFITTEIMRGRRFRRQSASPHTTLAIHRKAYRRLAWSRSVRWSFSPRWSRRLSKSREWWIGGGRLVFNFGIQSFFFQSTYLYFELCTMYTT